MDVDIPPNQTLYVKNLKARVNINELKSSLYALFATYGDILSVHVRGEEKLREQAFIAFANVSSATTAMRSLNGFVFYGHPLKIEYAKTKSDVVAKLDGTFKLKTHTSSATTVAKKNRNDDDDDDDDDDDE